MTEEEKKDRFGGILGSKIIIRPYQNAKVGENKCIVGNVDSFYWICFTDILCEFFCMHKFCAFEFSPFSPNVFQSLSRFSWLLILDLKIFNHDTLSGCG